VHLAEESLASAFGDAFAAYLKSGTVNNLSVFVPVNFLKNCFRPSVLLLSLNFIVLFVCFKLSL